MADGAQHLVDDAGSGAVPGAGADSAGGADGVVDSLGGYYVTVVVRDAENEHDLDDT